MDELQKHYAGSELDKYIERVERESESFSFIKIDFLVDMRVAENRYKEEYKKDIGGVRTALMSFGQWLDMKKFEASSFHVKHSDYYI